MEVSHKDRKDIKRMLYSIPKPEPGFTYESGGRTDWQSEYYNAWEIGALIKKMKEVFKVL